MVNVLFYLFLNIFELVSKVHGMRIELLKWSEGNCRLSQEHVIEKRDNKKKKIQYLWNSAYTRKITEKYNMEVETVEVNTVYIRRKPQ